MNKAVEWGATLVGVVAFVIVGQCDGSSWGKEPVGFVEPWPDDTWFDRDVAGGDAAAAGGAA